MRVARPAMMLRFHPHLRAVPQLGLAVALALVPDARAADAAGSLDPGPVTRWPAAEGGNGHSYQPVAAPAGIRWDAAQAWATAHNGHLATIGSAEENQFVFNLADDERYWSPADASYLNGPFLGGFKAPTPEGPDAWQWVNSEGNFTYTNWAPRQPDNLRGAENRLQFYSGQSADTRQPTWNDAPTTFAARGFVVEYETDAPGGPPASPAAAGRQALTAEQMAGIVLIEGDKGVATGFLATIRNIEVVVTNLHVLGDNERLVVRPLGGGTLTWSGIIGAVGSDIALLRVAKPTGQTPVLKLAEDVVKTAKIGDPVVVVGNRLGGGVATQATGRIKGLGPARVEVDAKFQPGNSGSPIFDTGIQQVVGVATYVSTARPGMAVESAPAPGAGESLTLKREERWFGYRLDNIEKWEAIDWPKWRAQMKRLDDYRATSFALLAVVLGDLSGTRDNPRVRDMIERYRLGVAGADARNSASEAAGKVRELMQAAGAYAREGLRGLDGPDYYDFFRTSLYFETNIAEQVRFREELIKALKDIEGDYRVYQQRVRR